MTTRAWNARLAVWRSRGHASPLTHLVDRVLSRGSMPVDSGTAEALISGPAPTLVVEVERAGIRYELPSKHVRTIASHVTWLTSPGGVHVGLVGNAPKRAVCAGNRGQSAVVLRTDDGDLLVPFDRLHLREAG